MVASCDLNAICIWAAGDIDDVVKAVKAARATGKGILAIAKELSIGTGTVQRIVSL